jgi:hypothetical protein
LTASPVSEINFSHYRPTPDSRRFSISTFAVTGQLEWEAKPASEFAAQLVVLKGAFAKMIPFKAIEASVKIVGGNTRVFSMQTVGGKNGDDLKEKTWTDLSVISPIEIPWVAEYALQRWSVGGPQEMFFNFEDNQRVRTAVLYFRVGSDSSGSGDAMAVLRVLKPEETATAGGAPQSIAKTQKDARPGDVLVTFRDGKIAGFTITVPLIGKLQFVAV